ncbi:MAG: methyltransferase domain-containing protein [Gemmatimonadetes bacterium]|nr:methyltransferase domain-containing protein [Gemmatimonadota bacterium]
MARREAAGEAEKGAGRPSAPPIDPQRLIALTPIRPHDTVADIGCGSGDLTIPLAKYVFDGKVYAVDVDGEALERVAKRAGDVHLGNVQTVLSRPARVPLEDGSLDGAVLASVLHETARPASLLKEVARLLRPGGWAAVIEWREEGGGSGSPRKRRLSGDDVSSRAADAGLRRVSMRNLDDKRYFVLLHR